MASGKKWLTLLVGIGFISGMPSLCHAKSVNEKILDILLESKIVTQEKYQELKAAVEQEEAELVKLKAAAEKKEVEGAKITFNRGFSIESLDGENKFSMSGKFQGDYRHFLGDSPNSDSFLMRRARIAAGGTFYKHYEFFVESEFGQNNVRLTDSFINVNYVPFAQFRFGQFRIPFLMDELRSSNSIDLVERSLADNFAPSRDLGLMFHGNIRNDLIYYQLGIFNGRQQNATCDVDDQKDIAGRITVAPFSKLEIPFLKDFHIGGSFTTGIQHTTNPSTDWWKNSFKTLGGNGTTFLQFQSNVTQDGNRSRLGGELAWIFGTVSLKAEYASLQLNDLKKGPTTGSFSGNSGYANFGWFLTGEKEPWKNGLPQAITPKSPFVFGKGGTGAYQILARYDWLEMEKSLLDKGFVDATQYTNKAVGYTLGLTWYPNEVFRFMLNYTKTNFDQKVTVSGTKVDSEDAILTRFQMVW
jgi:phosphate-selective porin OprO and OprP